MTASTCGRCDREFSSLSVFDAHQQVDYTLPRDEQVICLDPATLADRDGKPRFRLNRYGRWTTAGEMPPGTFKGRAQTAEQGPARPERHTSVPEALEAR